MTDAAAAVFRRLGYHRARMDDVAAALGITKSSLYHYVGTKEELLYRILLPPYRGALEHLLEVAATDAPAPERLARVVERHVRNTVEHYPAISIYLSASRDTPVPEEMRALDHAYTAGLKRIMVDGMREGSLAVHDPAIAVMAVLGMCNWFATTYEPAAGWDPDEVAATFAATCLHGLAVAQAQGAADV
ncbi:MAG: TetR/AcrR family transcriptional regulator [Acidimicrobiia bacterium]